MYKFIHEVNHSVEISTERKADKMIKGVTKSIIEITPRNSCFEKVIVILSSRCDPPDAAEIERQAALIAGTAPDHLLRQKRLSRLRTAVAAASGAFSTAVLFAFLYMFV